MWTHSYGVIYLIYIYHIIPFPDNKMLLLCVWNKSVYCKDGSGYRIFATKARTKVTFYFQKGV